MKKSTIQFPSERQYQAMIENARGVNMLMDAEGVIQYISPSSEKVLGRKAEDFVGNDRFDYISPDDRFAHAKAIETIRTKPGASVRVSSGWLMADGKVRRLECIFKNQLDDPLVGAVSGNCADYTELDSRTLDVANLQSNLKIVLDNSNDAIFSIDRKGRLITFNTVLKKIFHDVYHAEIEEGTDFVTYLHSDEQAFWGDAYGRHSRERNLQSSVSTMQTWAVGLSSLP